MDINQKEAVTYMEKKNLNHKHDEKCGCSPPKKSLIVADNAILEKIKDKNSLFLIGFPGVGMLGNIISSEFIKQLNMTQIGFVDSEDLPAIAVVYDGIIHHPFRLHFSHEKNILLAQCEIPFNKSSTYLDLARLLTDFAIKMGIKEICVVQGVIGAQVKQNVYVAAELDIIDKIRKAGEIEVLPKGLVFGPEAAILNECMNNSLNGYALLAPVHEQLPSPDSAAMVIKQLNNIYGFDLSTDKLLEEAAIIQDALQELNEKTKQQHAEINPAVPRLVDPKSNLYL
jgi:uncharacterized protein